MRSACVSAVRFVPFLILIEFQTWQAIEIAFTHNNQTKGEIFKLIWWITSWIGRGEDQTVFELLKSLENRVRAEIPLRGISENPMGLYFKGCPMPASAYFRGSTFAPSNKSLSWGAHILRDLGYPSSPHVSRRCFTWSSMGLKALHLFYRVNDCCPAFSQFFSSTLNLLSHTTNDNIIILQYD